MSALGSSVINKSAKKFAPKGPRRRPPAPPSSQASARHSVDRQVQSQTPQPQPMQSQAPQQPVPVFPTPSIPLPTPASTEQPVDPGKSARPRDEGVVRAKTSSRQTPAPDPEAVRISAPSRGIPVLGTGPARIPKPSSNILTARTASTPPIIPQKRHLESEQAPAPSASVLAPSASVRSSVERSQSTKNTRPARTPTAQSLIYSDFASPNRSSNAQSESSISTAGPVPSTTSDAQIESLRNTTQVSATKRRRVNKAAKVTKAKTSIQHPTTDANANVPLPTTEINDTVAEASASANTADNPTHLAKARKGNGTPQEKRVQRIEYPTASIVVAATRGSSALVNKPRRASKKRVPKTPAQVDPDTTADEPQGPQKRGSEAQAPAPVKANRARKPAKGNGKQTVEGLADEIVEDVVQGTSNDSKKRGRKPKRAPTPENAELIEIDQFGVKMADLCHDRGNGRMSVREQALREFERVELVRKKKRDLQELSGQELPSSQATPAVEPADARLERLGRRPEREEDVALHVPNTIIVDGQIQIDESSLQIDRHAAAAIERNAEQLDSIEESDLTHKVNAGTWGKRDKSGGWNEILLDRLYQGLRMFGTDFGMISKMFPGKTRRAVKLKFCKEEKFDEGRIKAALMGEPEPVDMDEYSKMAGTEFDDPEELQRDMDEDRRRLEEEMAAEKETMEQAIKERDEQVAAETAALGDESSSKENRGKGKKRAKGGKHLKEGARRRARQARPSGGMLEGVGESRQQAAMMDSVMG